MKSNKDLALEVNNNLYAHQDEVTLWWIIRNSNDRNITDWRMFEDDAWADVIAAYSF